MNTVFLFPGQGVQTPGMGKDLAEAYPQADAMFDKANEIVGYDLKSLCFNGPAEELNKTTISQPAIFTVSAALLEVLRTQAKETFPQPDVTAGLSMGEYSALYAAGVVSFEDGLKLVQKRGNAMQQAAEASSGSMVSLIGLDAEKVQQLCEEAAQGQVLAAVNFNCPGQIVVSGESEACKRAYELAEKYEAIKAVELDVAGAFHTSMMDPAAADLNEALKATPIAEPNETKVIANITADFYQNKEQIVDGLTKQLTSPILWQKCMETLLAQGCEKFYEIGPGRVLTGLMRRINRKTKVTNISDAASINKLLES